MATNQYFNFFTETNEQGLVNDLVVESIQIYGHDVRYIPRNWTYTDDIFNEVRDVSFTSSFEIEMYLANVQGFEGDGDLLSKFGVEVRDTMNLVVANTRWSSEVGANVDFDKPREGDLIYLPLADALLEIKFVEDEEVFYQLGKAYVWRLSCEFYEQTSGEVIDTGINEIDDVQVAHQYTIQLTMGDGSGTYQVGETVYQGASLADATAQATVTDWNFTDNIITVKDIIGNFSTGATVVGNTSNAIYTLGVKETMVFPDATDSDNLTIQTEFESFADFSESNPFSEDF
jgi:hypothetical protein